MPSELNNTCEALKYIDVVSPNHAELASLYDVSPVTSTGDIDIDLLNGCAHKLLDNVLELHPELFAVIRCGKDGCLITGTNDMKSPCIPAYHATRQDQVIDPTGGGNGFLGGFALGLVRTHDILQAVLWGSVSASLCIEQVGVPTMRIDAKGKETWNGVDVMARLEEFSRSCGY